MRSTTIGALKSPKSGVIIPPSLVDTLRHRPQGYARLCVACGSYLPPAGGQPLTWRSDGLCLRCYLSTAATIRQRQDSRHEKGPLRMSVAYFPDRLGDDERTPLRLRLLIELQKRGAALDWTPPISAAQLARQFDRSRSAVSRALTWAIKSGYLECQRCSLPRGGRGARYRAVLEDLVVSPPTVKGTPSVASNPRSH